MYSGDYARGFDFVEHLFQIFLAVGVVLSIDLVIADIFVRNVPLESGIVDVHQPESAHFGIFDMFVYISGIDLVSPIIGGVDKVASPAFGTSRQIEIFLQRSDVVQKIIGTADDECGPGAFEFELLDGRCRQDVVSLAFFEIDIGEFVGRQYVDRSVFIPADIEPFSKIRPAPDGQLQKTQLGGRRRGDFEILRIVFRLHDESFETESDIGWSLFDPNDRLPWDKLESDDQPVAFPIKRVGLKRGFLIGMGEFQLVVIGTILRDGENGHVLPLHQTLFAGGFQNKALGDGITPDNQPELVVFQNDTAGFLTGAFVRTSGTHNSCQRTCAQ